MHASRSGRSQPPFPSPQPGPSIPGIAINGLHRSADGLGSAAGSQLAPLAARVQREDSRRVRWWPGMTTPPTRCSSSGRRTDARQRQNFNQPTSCCLLPPPDWTSALTCSVRGSIDPRAPTALIPLHACRRAEEPKTVARSLRCCWDFILLALQKFLVLLLNLPRFSSVPHLTNLTRSLTARLEDSYCNITVANQHLVTVIRFVSKNYTHP